MATSKQKASLESQLRAGNSNAGLGVLQMARAIYDFSKDGAPATSTIIPAWNSTLPKGAVIVGGTINSTTAVTSTNACNVSIGTTAGSSATSILTATAKASFSTNALINVVPVFATPVKLTAQGEILFTFTDTAILGGVVEVTLLFYTAKA